MLSRLRKIFNTEEKKRLLSNFLSLFVLQGLNYVLPLLTFPYLVRVLGVDNFGLLAFATATITYFNILTDYGFNLTATKEVAIYRDNKEKLVEIFSSVMTIKFILMLVSFILLLLLLFSFSKFSDNKLIYILTFGIVIGQMLFPVWFFQGMERMKYITYLNIFSKSIFTVAIFLMVKSAEDIWLVPLLTSLGFIIAGICSLFLIKRLFGIKFKFQSKERIKFYLKDGWHVFISRFYVSVYTTTNIVILGFLTNNTIVGYYSIAEKIVMAIGGLFQPANRAIYPYLARKYKYNFKQFYSFVKKVSICFFGIAFLFFLLALLFKDSLIYIVNGKESEIVSAGLSIFLIWILTAPYGSLFSNVLIIMKKNKEFLKVMNYTVVIDLLIVPVATYFYGLNGIIFAFVLVVVFHVLLLFYYMNKSVKKEIM